MYLYGIAVSTAALFSTLAYAVPVAADTSGSTATSSANNIVKLDASSGCLPSTLNDISAENRETISSVAQALNSSVFRDFHQFGPVALALGKPDIQEKITGNDYPATIVGLSELKSYMDSELPSIAQSASGSKSGCDAPTVQNLQVVYSNLAKLLRQFN